MSVLAAFRAEWYKTLRRPAVWVVFLLVIALAIGLEYVVIYLVATHPPPATQRGAANTAAALARLKPSVFPAAFDRKTLNATESLMGVFALILGVLLQGSEYGWQTLKTSFSQGPGRLAVLAGRLLTVAVVVAALVVVLFASDALAAYVLARVDGAATAFPAIADIAKAGAAAWLILAIWAGIGFVLATAFRQSAMAIGLGLAYGLLIEPLAFSLLAGLGDVVKQVHVWFPIANAGYLVQSFGPIPGSEAAAAAIKPDADGTHATLVLLVYLVAFVVISAGLTRSRDVL